MEASLPPTQVFAAEPGADPVGALASARRPVILAGIAALRLGGGPAISNLAERAGIPVVVSPMAKGVVPEDHPWFAGIVDMACNQVVGELLSEADLVLAVGFDAVELIKPWKVRARVVHIDAVPNTDQIYQAEIEIVGAIGPVVEWLTEQHRSEQRWTLAEVQAHRKRLREAYYQGRVAGRLNPTDVVDVVRAYAPRDAIVTTDVGSHKLLVGQGWTTYEPRTSLMSNGLSSMGFSLPAAIGAKLARPDRPVVCTTGDGGFAMVQGELRLASSLGLGMIVVVFCDGSLNRIELKQMRLGYPSTATRIEGSDIVRLAESMDCYGARVQSTAELEKVLAEADFRRLDRPLVIEATVDPAQYESQY
ncbi:thiamine pyrophosphate-dependent enzyme [Georgenia sp. 10Sc9-8]|uniref:Thiamine pyrophosphate-dependent enzyme n=1 Tax=Georgenia halotolerans TaxID=3028317 RepID=A0ABT5TTZ3_9MICO|nr:thiamine pyrophosphate-dependent enzyme [Georgenia halotolerans]